MRSSKGNNKCVYWEHVFECRTDISRNMYRLEKVFWKIFRTCFLDHIMLYRKLSWFSGMFSHGDSYLWLVMLMLFHIIMIWKVLLHYSLFERGISGSLISSHKVTNTERSYYWRFTEQQSSCRWFETPWRSCDVTLTYKSITNFSKHGIMSAICCLLSCIAFLCGFIIRLATDNRHHIARTTGRGVCCEEMRENWRCFKAPHCICSWTSFTDDKYYCQDLLFGIHALNSHKKIKNLQPIPNTDLQGAWYGDMFSGSICVSVHSNVVVGALIFKWSVTNDAFFMIFYDSVVRIVCHIAAL